MKLDLFKVSELLSPQEQNIKIKMRAFLDAEILPHISDWWEQGTVPRELAPKLGKLGILGATLPQSYGASEMSNIAYGLIMYELERIDSGIRSFASVQGALVMYAIYTYGSEKSKLKYLPMLANGDLIGCFGLTESVGGSDPGAMRMRARRTADSYILDGTKMWITNGSIADIAIIWAKDDDGIIRGFIVPTDSPGFKSNPIKRKMSLRAADTSELVLNNVRIPMDQILPAAHGLSAPLSCLNQGRYSIAWGALGALEAVYIEALTFAKSRLTFGKPIAAKQLVQANLTQMLSDHTSGLLLAWRLGKLKDEGTITSTQVSLTKRQNVRAALNAARAARGILGAKGITLHNNTIRHMLNLESVETYEGTYEVQTLIIGRDITGFRSF